MTPYGFDTITPDQYNKRSVMFEIIEKLLQLFFQWPYRRQSESDLL